ncbi:uncharacterized protein TNCV_2760211 [Trichonephila clavipes]|nr:uncharacterized protein TNCV_2760211 [Trichonephila clavipes]
MFANIKGFKKEYLLLVAEEIGEYKKDSDFVTSALITSVEDRKQREVRIEEIDREEKERQRQYEMDEKERQRYHFFWISCSGDCGKFSANYAKAVEGWKAHFGRKDLLVEVYVRGLLKLVISVHKNAKFSMTSLYDKMELHMRILETLGVTTDKCASILYPVVESCFSEDFLKAWKRLSTSSVDAKERLSNLMQFIKAEVEGEERINLAMLGLGLNEPKCTQSYKKKQCQKNPTFYNSIPTAANLLTTASTTAVFKCIFCDGKH